MDNKETVNNTKKNTKSTNQKETKGTSKKSSVVKSVKDKIVNTIDINGDGNIDIEDVITLGLRSPGVKIKRDKFLRKEFEKRYSEEVIDKAISKNPASAGIDVKEIDKIADEIIKYERNCVSGISAALSAPGGIAMVATIPADLIQYYGYMLRATQKLMYLYGFPEINVEEKNQIFDSETMNILIICLGVMYGVAGANNALKAIAKGLATGISKKIMRTALTKTTWYPIVKSTANWFGKKITKEVLAGAVKNSLPVVGGVIGGTITFVSFKPCCDRLKKSLQDTMLSNPNNHKESKEENLIADMGKDN